MKRIIMALALGLFLVVNTGQTAQAKCNARFLNPITEICWDCIFPISVGGISRAAQPSSIASRH